MEGRSSEHHIHRFQSLQEYADEHREFRENRLDPQMAPTEVTFLVTQLAHLVRSAMRGQVSFAGSDPEGKAIAGSDFLYELRPRNRSALRRPRRELRLYCAEPHREPKLIVGLHLATKPGDQPDLAGEQDASIREANRRADNWEWQRATGSSAHA